MTMCLLETRLMNKRTRMSVTDVKNVGLRIESRSWPHCFFFAAAFVDEAHFHVGWYAPGCPLPLRPVSEPLDLRLW
jgi:hypothetical protein